ncbi:HAD hydrolase-like protein [Candidatus Woesearchaeota archaeon]|nr:HAD hydrolase-like protein [Candidatus Woesearchaeota archaeon]
MSSKKLVLFDVDHTLMDVGDSHKKAFAKAFKKTYNIEVDYSEWAFNGYTDLQIINELIEKNNLEKDPKKVAEIIQIMIKEFQKENLEHSFLLDGVKETLEKLDNKDNVILGLVTGNIEAIAYTKLKHLKIRQYFILGGFGHSSDIRSELVESAVKQAENKLGKINKRDVFIIGDTVHDIEAAKDAGVRVIAVATGVCGYGELKKKKPDFLLHDLKDTGKLMDVIMNG